ncbi:TonB family protein [Gimibacter soli]|uniref:TonB family protein n=1 Tax=Gimibacter soli TaxID=3024400 RepID=A0AAE9XSK1_9PROT|nr:TonB family protein [Gimibacter soli]WCL54321.1 TonB family protein [Gimibacter soli]
MSFFKVSGLKHLSALAVAGVLAATTVGVPGAMADVGAWRKAMVKHIIDKHIYPRSAIQQEVEGTAKVRLTIDRAGTIVTYEIVEPTGQAILDETIPQMLDRMNPVPPPPDDVPDSNLTFVLPLSWRLQ